MKDEKPLQQVEDSLLNTNNATFIVKSGQLILNGKELVIEHGNEIYRLRITKQDKLILTK